ncbi:MAG: metallophosphoesterase [Thermoanaerobaculia bacterium]
MTRSLATIVLTMLPSIATAHPGTHIRLELLEERIAADSGNGELYLQRGRIHHSEDAWDAALADYDRAAMLGAAPDAVDMARAELLQQADRPGEALLVLERLLGRRPDHPKALLVRARARSALGHADAAADDYQRVLSMSPGASPELYLEISRALARAGRDGDSQAGFIRRRSSAGWPDPRAFMPERGGATNADPYNAGGALEVTRGPYLQRGTPTSLVVRWRTDEPSDSRVAYGTDPGNLARFAEDLALVTDHVVEVTGLVPDTTHFYSIGTSAGPLVGGDDQHFFITAPDVGTAKPTRIWVLGDSGTANDDARAVRDAYAAFAAGQPTDVWLMLGDNAYLTGTDVEYQAAVFDTYPEQLRNTVLWPTLGNHDGISADSSTQTGPYYDIFTLPRFAEAGGVASGTEAYYSFDYANVHFICLDSHESDRSPGGAMLTWLTDDLTATAADWIVAFWHHPPYTKGSHDSDSEGRLIQMRQNVLPILEGFGVDLVLAGHSHSYERSFLLDSHYGPSDTLDPPTMILDDGDGNVGGDGPYEKPTLGPAPHEGTVYAVAGSSGQIGGGSLDHPAMFFSLAELGSLVLDVDGELLTVRFLDAAGTIADELAIVKGGFDADGDGVPDAVDPCLGDNAAGDADGDEVCDDLDCDDADPEVGLPDGCGVCGGDNSSCGIFEDGFESGDTAAW